MSKFFIINFFLLNYPSMINTLLVMLILFPIKYYKFHPMNMIFILIIYSFFMTLKINYLKLTWMHFILFLIMIGGMMIIFSYITSLISNKLTSINIINLNIIFVKIFYLVLFIVTLNNFLNFNWLINSQELNMPFFSENLNFLTLNKIYSINKFPLMFIMLYLYFSLICIMNICYKFNNPLRKLNFYE
uniref:NADH dehydrogenase subunit 6 n=1 Tax=Hypsicera sp. ZJUH_2016019 TaxID=2491161 RepID=A0A3Q8UA46_9HYME|nr:NADH dehydrogenase subunit 6 [Hypsicera sp. ZJUH_2016019]